MLPHLDSTALRDLIEIAKTSGDKAPLVTRLCLESIADLKHLIEVYCEQLPIAELEAQALEFIRCGENRKPNSIDFMGSDGIVNGGLTFKTYDDDTWEIPFECFYDHAECVKREQAAAALRRQLANEKATAQQQIDLRREQANLQKRVAEIDKLLKK